jgi:phosphoglycerate dehydrogenase-like enzyme
MPKVMIAPSHLRNLPGGFYDTLKAERLELFYPKNHRQMTEQELIDEMPGMTASLAGSEPYTRKVIESLPDLKVIARAGVGYDGVDVPAATERGILVAIAPGTNQDAVTEHAFGLILGLAKNIINQHNRIKAGEWPRHANLPIRGMTLGLIGLGRIGKSMALRGQAFGMKIVAYEPYPDKAFIEKHQIKLTTLEEVLKSSDWVSLHLPASAESRHLINQKTIELMKPSAFLINTARGAVVNETDLYEALKSKRLAGAGLDVFDQEPPGANPLLTLDNVLITAHTAGVDTQSRDDMALVAAQVIARCSRGEWPAECVVNPEVKGKFKWPRG